VIVPVLPLLACQERLSVPLFVTVTLQLGKVRVAVPDVGHMPRQTATLSIFVLVPASESLKLALRVPHVLWTGHAIV
jgi:hypothetical protein